ncbi:MAG: His/Gly/Thr/Pro-type tRNA ligase C-terminal domain-containing protein [bacterium]|nr:His/Gly/Thr/Pro-type tRNA ligase C-terminal domain-containing protein [bacterium]
MKRSELFTKSRKQAPADEVSKNAQLLLRAGFIHKDAAGIYLWLPLGWKVLNNIMAIIREEMNSIGGREVLMSSLQRQELWESTDRWNDEIVDVWFKTEYKNGTQAGLAWSHEEQMTDMMKQFINSYRDLPAYVYQFQNKLRNETRAKSGIMRTREFIMKDLYSFVRNDEEHKQFYEKTTKSYKKIFDRLGIGDKTYFTFASGGAFAEFSHEFQTICDAGEDTVYIHKAKNIAINEEVMRDDVLKMLGVERDELEQHKTAEVGNIFSFGTSKSEPMGLKFTDEDGTEKNVVMGSYGIGPARVMGVIAELMSDDKGLVWPSSIAPYQVYLATVGVDESVSEAAEELYKELNDAGIEVLYDDRDERPGEKFSDADLFGIPYRIVISPRTLDSESCELKLRTSDEAEQIKISEIIGRLKA